MKLLISLLLCSLLTGCAGLHVQWAFHAEYETPNEQVSK